MTSIFRSFELFGAFSQDAGSRRSGHSIVVSGGNPLPSQIGLTKEGEFAWAASTSPVESSGGGVVPGVKYQGLRGLGDGRFAEGTKIVISGTEQPYVVVGAGGKGQEAGSEKMIYVAPQEGSYFLVGADRSLTLMDADGKVMAGKMALTGEDIITGVMDEKLAKAFGVDLDKHKDVIGKVFTANRGVTAQNGIVTSEGRKDSFSVASGAAEEDLSTPEGFKDDG